MTYKKTKATDRKEKWLFPLLIILCIAAVSGMFFVLAFGRDYGSKEAEFVPPSFEDEAKPGIPDVPEDLDWEELDATAFRASLCGKLVLNGDAGDVWLMNPESNTVWLKLRVLDAEGNIIGETGLIKPGEYVRSVTFDETPEDRSPVVLKLMAYEPNTYHSAGAVSLNTVAATGGAE